jgi:SAM-dependent methyltransferase
MPSNDRPIDVVPRPHPRSERYELRWAMEHCMGPNALWLTEDLTDRMGLLPGMRILDLGCGKALSSIFLAREFDMQVWAFDLWVVATENWNRVLEAGESHRVFPIHGEAHALPFAEGFFDAAVSVDAYHYFGTDDLYLAEYLAPLVRPGGQIGIVVPGIAEEIDGTLPAHLAVHWPPDFWTFHSPAWWRRQWERSGAVEVEVSDRIPDGWRDWLWWDEACGAEGFRHDDDVPAMLRHDAGRTLGFTRMVARVRDR